jgi:hypothetical protein
MRAEAEWTGEFLLTTFNVFRMGLAVGSGYDPAVRQWIPIRVWVLLPVVSWIVSRCDRHRSDTASLNENVWQPHL